MWRGGGTLHPNVIVSPAEIASIGMVFSGRWEYFPAPPFPECMGCCAEHQGPQGRLCPVSCAQGCAAQLAAERSKPLPPALLLGGAELPGMTPTPLSGDRSTVWVQPAHSTRESQPPPKHPPLLVATGSAAPDRSRAHQQRAQSSLCVQRSPACSSPSQPHARQCGERMSLALFLEMIIIN